MFCFQVPEDPFFFCNDCFRQFNYSPKNEKVGNFKAYPFIDVNALWSDSSLIYCRELQIDTGILFLISIRAHLLWLAQVINGKNYPQSPFGYLYHSKYEGPPFIQLRIQKLNMNSIIYPASEALHSAHGPCAKVCKINDVLLIKSSA